MTDEPRPGAGNFCDDCGERLRISRNSPRKLFKSCPNCSGFTETHHAYRKVPDEFGTTDPRVTTNHPDGEQSWCDVCRKLNLPHWQRKVNGAPYVRCRDVQDAEFSAAVPTPPTVRRKN